MGTPEKRFKEHIRDARKERCEKRPLYSAFQKYGPENFQLETIEECSAEELSNREKYWIEYFGTFKYGYNATTGGDGSSFINYDDVVRLYREIRNKKRVSEMLGICYDSVIKILKAKGEDTVKPVYNNPATWKPTPVMAYDFNGVPIKYFPSKHDAAKWLIEQGKCKSSADSKSKEKGIVGHISGCCKGKRKTAYGYVWKDL